MRSGAAHRKTTLVAEVLGAAVGLLLFASCSAYVVTAMAGHSGDRDVNYVAHVREHGVGHGVTQLVGSNVCGELQRGQSGSAEVSRVSHGADGDFFTLAESEVIVYWAAHDLCPREVSRVSVSWQDGK